MLAAWQLALIWALLERPERQSLIEFGAGLARPTQLPKSEAACRGTQYSDRETGRRGKVSAARVDDDGLMRTHDEDGFVVVNAITIA